MFQKILYFLFYLKHYLTKSLILCSEACKNVIFWDFILQNNFYHAEKIYTTKMVELHSVAIMVRCIEDIKVALNTLLLYSGDGSCLGFWRTGENYSEIFPRNLEIVCRNQEIYNSWSYKNTIFLENILNHKFLLFLIVTVSITFS